MFWRNDFKFGKGKVFLLKGAQIQLSYKPLKKICLHRLDRFNSP